MKQTGFGSLTLYAAIGAAVIIGGLSIALKVQSSRLEAVKAEYEGFKTQVRVLGEQAEKAKQAREAKDKATKEKIDRETKTLRANNAVLAKRLRDERSRGGILPGTGTPAASAATITFDRPELERALQRFDEGVSGLLTEGDQAVIDLNLSLKWAKEIR